MRHRVTAAGLERLRKSETFFCGPRTGGLQVREAQLSLGKGPCLVQHHIGDARQRLDRGAAREHNAALRQCACSRREHYRSGEPERARAGHHEHRDGDPDRTRWIDGEPSDEGCRRSRQDDPCQGARDPVGRLDQTRPARRGPFDQPPDRGGLRFGAGVRHLHRQGLGDVDRSPDQARTLALFHREGLPGQQRLVSAARSSEYDAVRRNGLPRSNQDRVPGAKLVRDHAFAVLIHAAAQPESE